MSAVLRAACALAAFASTVAIAQAAPEAGDHLDAPAFKAAYVQALGAKAKTPWLARRDGPAPMPSYESVAGERFVMNSFCKKRDCAEHSAVILYSPAKGVVYGTVHEKGVTTLIGAPPPAVASALARLWKKEWRSPPG